jgi:hypothetical protein
MKPLAQEEDVLVFLESGGKRKYYYVYQTEDIVYDDRSNWMTTNAVATNTLGTSVQLSELEPDLTSEPEVQIYQLRCGVRGRGLVYVELMAGTHRRGTWRKPRPTSSNYYIGYLDDTMSPAEDPQFEMFLRHNQYPAFAVYNNSAVRKAEVELHFVGKKLKCFDMEKASGKTLGLDDRVLADLLARVRAGTWAHRAITPKGLEA